MMEASHRHRGNQAMQSRNQCIAIPKPVGIGAPEDPVTEGPGRRLPLVFQSPAALFAQQLLVRDRARSALVFHQAIGCDP